MPIIVIIGPSGAGKSTLVDMYTRRHQDAALHKSATTRAQRNEYDNSHVFMTDEEFDQAQQEGKFIQAVEIYGHHYGLPTLPDDTSNTLLLLLRAQYVTIFKQYYPDCHVIQIEAPVPVLTQRLVARGDSDRADKTELALEMTVGQGLADTIISTDAPLDQSFQEFEDACTKLS